jgi:nucleoside recognition membrane protein YjiH
MEQLKVKDSIIQKYTLWTKARFFILSLFGIFMFFVPITLGGKSTIPIDHIVTFVKTSTAGILPYYALAVIILGAVFPFYKKTWNATPVSMFFSVAKIAGVGVAVMAIFKWGPAWLFEPDMLPFLFDKLVMPVGILVPIGSAFLAFMVGYGLLEFVGVIMQPVMRPLFMTPGKSAVDAVASFVGSYSIALLITNKVFKDGQYTIKEAAIIATGFSTVSTTFMIIVAKTLGLMDRWNFYFWTTMLVTFIVTAITARLFPLNRMKDEYVGTGHPEKTIKGDLLKHALQHGYAGSHIALPIWKNVYENLRDGFRMTMGILPTILSIGLLGLTLAKFTPLFDVMGYAFLPWTLLAGIPDAMLAAKGCAVELAEMFLPALLTTEAAPLTRYVMGVMSVSSIMFFSASIPCILSTEIPLKIKDIIIIWYQRTALSVLLAAGIGHLFL